MKIQHVKIDSPVGVLTLVSDGRALIRIHFGKLPAREAGPELTAAEDSILARAARQLGEYFDGKRASFDLPLDPAGTEFQKRVWKELSKIPFGRTSTYAELARRIGAPKASRAVGGANGRNPLPIVVPCHRVIGKDGSLTGFAFGIGAKQKLLAHEGVRFS